MARRSPRSGLLRATHVAARWRPRNNGQVWLAVLTLNIAVGLVAVFVPHERHILLGLIMTSVGATWLGTQSRRQRRERAELAARLAIISREDIPAEVVSLVTAGKKIQAIKRYRDLTGTRLTEAKAVIDSL